MQDFHAKPGQGASAHRLATALESGAQGATWQERVLNYIDLRSDIYDRTAAMHLAAQVHRHESVFLARNLMNSAALQRDLLRRLLPAPVARNALLLDALDLLLSFEAWIRLRREQGLDANQARQVVRLAVNALLATVPRLVPCPPPTIGPIPRKATQQRAVIEFGGQDLQGDR